MDSRHMSETYSEIAKRVIEREDCLSDIAESSATIVYLASTAAKTTKGCKKVLGECEKVAEKNKWAIPADFTITIFEPNIVGLTEEQIEILLLHELLHVGIEKNDDGSERYFCKPHDYDDFKLITDRYGTEWAKSIYDE